MATEPRIDVHGEGHIFWMHFAGPVDIVPYPGQCRHDNGELMVIAWGWDVPHYQLMRCHECSSRAWADHTKTITGPWMQPSMKPGTLWSETDEESDNDVPG